MGIERKNKDGNLSEKEVANRRDAALLTALKTPPKPRKKPKPKVKESDSKKSKGGGR